MTEIITWPMPYYYFCCGKIRIVSDAPGGPEAMKQFPELEVKTLAEWESQCGKSDHSDSEKRNQ